MTQERTPLEIEEQGYKAGINPFFGEFERTFSLIPVSSGSKNERKRFNEKVQKELEDIKFIYYGELKVDITLYLDEQKRVATAELADLDNCVKVICDSLKGTRGIMIDDSQIQSLCISWIDTPKTPYFDVRLRGHPDEYVLKPVSLYEMPNHLFYPVSLNSWTKKGIVVTPHEQRWLLLAAVYSMIDRERDFKQTLQKNGVSSSELYGLSRGLKPILAGFPKGRVVESGFTLHSLKDSVDDKDFQKALATLESRITKQPS